MIRRVRVIVIAYMSDSFSSFGLDHKIVNILARKGITEPTPIQARAIPVVLQGRDVIGIAQTGTGKTLAFGLPLIEKMVGNQKKALIIAPTRELAVQIEQNIKAIAHALPVSFKVMVIMGGVPQYRQVKELKRNPRMIVATPGRLVDLMEQRLISLHDIDFFVLDEADRMFDMGFAPQVQKIAAAITRSHQTLLFSATMSAPVTALAARYQHDPVRIEVSPANTSSKNVRHELHYVPKEHKLTALKGILQGEHPSVLVFSRTKHGARKLRDKIAQMGHQAADIHSNKSLSQRKAALEGFRSGQYRVLVATDVVSRGIDVADIALVVNYDLPDAAEDYVHRTGRTGRAGKDGYAISLATPDQKKLVYQIERLMQQRIPVAQPANRTAK